MRIIAHKKEPIPGEPGRVRSWQFDCVRDDVVVDLNWPDGGVTSGRCFACFFGRWSFWRKPNLGELPLGENRATLDLDSRVNQILLLEKQQECASRDFATVIW